MCIVEGRRYSMSDCATALQPRAEFTTLLMNPMRRWRCCGSTPVRDQNALWSMNAARTVEGNRGVDLKWDKIPACQVGCVKHCGNAPNRIIKRDYPCLEGTTIQVSLVCRKSLSLGCANAITSSSVASRVEHPWRVSQCSAATQSEVLQRWLTLSQTKSNAPANASPAAVVSTAVTANGGTCPREC